MAEELDSLLDSLNDEKREEFEEQIESKKKRIEQELHNEYRRTLENQIQDDEEELQDFNIVISAFLDRPEVDYTFIRTEPLYHEGEKNFDVLIASNNQGIGIFVECERSLISELSRKINEFRQQVELIEENNAGVDIEEYLAEVIGESPDQNEYVIASKQLSDSKLTNEAEKKEFSFVAWDLTPSGNRCKVRYHIAKESPKAPFSGHSDDDLMEYIKEVLVSGVPYQDYIDFTYSSSNYLKVRNIVLVIVNRHLRKGPDNFDYSDWRDLFKIELSNYKDPEKETIYRNFIEEGQKYGLVELDEDLGNILDNKFRIISQASTDQEKLITEIYNKMADTLLEDDLDERLKEEKRQVASELKKEQATGGTTLFDFMEDQGENN